MQKFAALVFGFLIGLVLIFLLREIAAAPNAIRPRPPPCSNPISVYYPSGRLKEWICLP